jgi:hypothetical protein
MFLEELGEMGPGISMTSSSSLSSYGTSRRPVGGTKRLMMGDASRSCCSKEI